MYFASAIMFAKSRLYTSSSPKLAGVSVIIFLLGLFLQPMDQWVATIDSSSCHHAPILGYIASYTNLREYYIV